MWQTWAPQEMLCLNTLPDSTPVPGGRPQISSEGRAAKFLTDASSFLLEGKGRVKKDFKLCLVLGTDWAVPVDVRNLAVHSPFSWLKHTK